MRIIFPSIKYEEALERSNLATLASRRQQLTDNLFQSVLQDKDHKLNKLLPKISSYEYDLRTKKKFKPHFNTNRFRDSFIIHNSLKETF